MKSQNIALVLMRTLKQSIKIFFVQSVENVDVKLIKDSLYV